MTSVLYRHICHYRIGVSIIIQLHDADIMGCVMRCGFCLLEDHMIRDFSHELSDTQKHVEQMVQQMMTSLANIRLARLTTEMVQYYA